MQDDELSQRYLRVSRLMSLVQWVGECCKLLARHAETAFAALKVANGFVEFNAPEVGPIAIGDVNFGVSKLPQEKITDSELAAGANEQIGVWHAVGSKESFEDFVGYIVGV